MNKHLLLAICLITSLSLSAQNQWRSAYYPENWTAPVTKNFYTDAFLQDYSYAGYHRGEIAIPNPSNPVYDVTKAPYNADKTGVNDATTAIQNAINAAQNAGGGVVYLPTGTYKLNPGTRTSCLLINKNNIVLKGDGIGKTFLFNTSYTMNNKAIISVSGSSSSSWTTIPSSKALLTADVMNPVSILSVDNPSLFQVGDLVVVRNTINDDWITEHKETEWLGGGSSLRGIMFCRYITAVDVNNKTISIDLPVRYALKTRDAACVFKVNGMISEVGLQDFSIANVQHPGTTGWGENDYTNSTNSSYDCAGSYVIKFNTLVNGWMKNIATYQPTGNTTKAHMLSNGILVQFSKGITIDNCNMSYAQYGGGGGNGYSYRVSANEVLISNSTASYVRHGFVFSSMWCSGNVFHKCRDIKNGFQTGNTGNMNTSGWGSDHHMHFSQSNLIDQCYSENSAYVAFYRPYGSTPKHNLTAAHTTFWNISSAGSSAAGSRGYCVWTQQSRYGYAIGTSGSNSTIRTNEASSGSAVKTDPVDIAEGQGQGTSLVPQSLYLDQLDKRLFLLQNPLTITRLQLIDAANGSTILGYENLENTKINKTLLSVQNFNIYAEVSSSVDSVIFSHTHDGITLQRKEAVAPYALRGDGSGYQVWTLPMGLHEISVTAYKTGQASASKHLAFTVDDGTITSLEKDTEAHHVKVFPNPTAHTLSVTASQPIKEIVIYNAANQEVFSQTLGGVALTKEINLSELTTGIYFIKVDGHLQKFMKQ